MKSNPLVSIIICSRNRETLLSEAINSVYLQTYHNFEIIVIDDASEPSYTVDLISPNIPILYYKNDKNLGANASRKVGLEQAQGKYVCFLDDDDKFLPNKLDKMVSLMEEQQHVVLCTCYARSQKKKIKTYANKKRLKYVNSIGSFSLPIIRNSSSLSAYLPADLNNGQDWFFWKRIAEVGQISIIQEELVFFNEGGHKRISNATNKLDYYSNYLRVGISNNSDFMATLFHNSIFRFHTANGFLLRYINAPLILLVRLYLKFWLK